MPRWRATPQTARIADPELQLVEGPDRRAERAAAPRRPRTGWKISVWLRGSGDAERDPRVPERIVAGEDRPALEDRRHDLLREVLVVRRQHEPGRDQDDEAEPEQQQRRSPSDCGGTRAPRQGDAPGSGHPAVRAEIDPDQLGGAPVALHVHVADGLLRPSRRSFSSSRTTVCRGARLSRSIRFPSRQKTGRGERRCRVQVGADAEAVQPSGGPRSQSPAAPGSSSSRTAARRASHRSSGRPAKRASSATKVRGSATNCS